MRGSGVEEAHNVGTQKRLCDALPGEDIGRNNRIRAGFQQMLLRRILAGARQNAQIRVETASCQDDIEIGGIGRGGRDQAPGFLDAGFTQDLLLRRIADLHKPAFACEFLGLGFAVLDDDERRDLVFQK